MKPRCRWLIDGKLAPYRVLVSLIENRRVDGRVCQEQIADLGSIEGHLLLGFFPEGEASSFGNFDQWHYASVQARDQFWCGVRERLARLANRISTEAASEIIASLAARIPIPTEDDFRALDLYDWKNAARSFQYFHDSSEARIESNARTRALMDEEDVLSRQDADENATNMVKAQTEVLKRLKRSPR
jgi:hypothetical protein